MRPNSALTVLGGMTLALALSGCGGAGGGSTLVDPAGATSGPVAVGEGGGADGTTEAAAGAAADGGATEAAAEPADGAAELPAFMSDFARVCTTQVGFPGAAAYNAEPRVHPIQLFEEFRDEDSFLETSRTLPQAWVVAQDDNFEDNSELAAVELIGCSDRVSQTPNGTMCEFDSDGDEITLELVDATYEVAIYEAATGEEVASGSLEANRTTCPMFVSFQEGQTELLNTPTDDQIIKLLKPTVAP